MACPKCGSWAVRADRSLSGRMVCARCGHPLGQRLADSDRRSTPGRGRSWRQRRWLLWSGLTALVALSAVLAAKPPAESQGGAWREPAGSPGLRVPIR
jgi:ribosomal protein S27AE